MPSQPDLASAVETGSSLSPTGKLRAAQEAGDLRKEWRLGRKKARWTDWLDPRRLLAIVVVLGVGVGVGMVSIQKSSQVVESGETVAKQPPADSHQTDGQKQIQTGVNRVYKVAGAYWACKDEATLERVDQLLIANDVSGLNALKQTGDISLLKPGQSVQWLGSSGYLGSRVRLRMMDSKTEFWASREALR